MALHLICMYSGESVDDHLAAMLLFNLFAYGLCPAVHPYYSIVKWFTCSLVPDKCSLTLVSDAQSLHFDGASFVLCCLQGPLYAEFDSLPYLLRIVLYPSASEMLRT